MEIAFNNEGLKSICEQSKTAQRQFGPASAKKLRTRLADLQAARNVSELVAGRPHPLKGDRAGQFAVDLHGGHRLVFEAANDPIPSNDDKSIDWSKVTAVRVVFVGNYHD